MAIVKQPYRKNYHEEETEKVEITDIIDIMPIATWNQD